MRFFTNPRYFCCGLKLHIYQIFLFAGFIVLLCGLKAKEFDI